MKFKKLLLAISLFTLINGMAYSIDQIDEYPSETLILKLPDNSEDNWKEIFHHVNKNEGIIERIPLNQTIKNWSNLICIQYYDISKLDRPDDVIQGFLDSMKNTTLSSYPDKLATWKLIEKTSKGAIYEWMSYHNSTQHEVARVVLTNTGLHRIGFTKKNGIMSSDERQKWIKLLRENTLLASFQKASKSNGLSLANKLQDSLSLEKTDFSDWVLVDTNTLLFDSGFTSVCYIPTSQIPTSQVGKYLVGEYLTECLEIATAPNTQELSINQFFDRITAVLKENHNKVNIQVLQKSPKEIIYTYSHPKDHLLVNAVVRMFLTDHGCYSITYKRGLEGLLEKEESLKWQEKLKTIHVKTKAQ